MRVRLKENHFVPGYPIIEIIPESAEFDKFSANVEIVFFDLDDEGTFYRPTVRPNVNLSPLMSPLTALEWGETLVAASQVARRMMPPYWDGEQHVYAIAWMKVDEICKRPAIAARMKT